VGEDLSKAAPGACWRWRSLPEPASMLDLDGPLSRRTGEGISLRWGGRGLGGERGTISLFQIQRAWSQNNLLL
jgi:hypothetical protein